MSEQYSDNTLAARLRDVPLPPGLLARLRSVSELTDGELDAMLRGGPLPPGVQERLRVAVADDLLDGRLRDVPVPRSLLARLRVLPAMRPRRPVARLAVAASLMLLLGGLQLAALARLSWSLRVRRPAGQEVLLIDHGPLQLDASPQRLAHLDWSPGVEVTEPSRATETGPAVEVQLVDWRPGVDGPADSAFVGLADTGSWWTDVLRLRWGPLGAPQSGSEELPELEASPLVESRGAEPPAAAGVDRLFFLRYGVHPPLFPNRDERLRTASLPLSAETTSLERTWQVLGEGRLPRPGEVRVEDFLAGVPYRFEPPDARTTGSRTTGSQSPAAQSLALRTAAGPHFFGDKRAGLLLLGVAATTEIPRRQPGSHLTVALDVSESMRFGRRLAQVREALLELLPSLGDHDRLSLVAFNQDIAWVVEQAGKRDASELRQVLGSLRAGGGTNLSAGLQQAVSLAMEPPLSTDLATATGRPVRELIVLTDGRAGMPATTRTAMRQMLAEAAQQGLSLRILDLGDEHIVDPQLAELAMAARGHVDKVGTADQIRWKLREALTGNSAVVAEDAVLRMEFNPDVVAAYRLVGHEATSLAMVSPVDLPATLRAEQAAGVLLEVWLQPGSDDLVGWADLEWRDPRTGQLDKLRQRISRLQFAASFEESPLNLQAAAVAAEAAELLRGSYRFELDGPNSFRAVPKSDDWDRLLRRAESVHPALAGRPDFERFVELIRRVDDIRRRRLTE